MRLSVINRGGWPVIVSLWFLYEDGRFWAASRHRARIVDYLSANPRCGFEIARDAPPYCGVRGYGLAEMSNDTDARLLTRLADRYLGSAETPFRHWLIAGATEETAIAIVPESLMSWDYRARMSGAA